MPGYAVISGYFSNPDMNAKRIIGQGRFFLAFLIQHMFVILLTVPSDHATEVEVWKKANPDWNATGSDLSPPSIMPIQFFGKSGADWFLFTLVVWRCALPLLARFKWPLTTSVILALFMMFTDVGKSVYSNAPFVFGPFFVLGYVLKKDYADKFAAWRQKVTIRIIFVIFALTLVLARQFQTHTEFAIMQSLSCMYGGMIRDPFRHQLGAGQPVPPETTWCQSPIGVISVLGFYVVSAAMIIGFATVVPKQQVWLLTKAGVNSLYIYLCHIWFGMYPLLIVANGIAVSKGPAPILYSLLSVLIVTFLVWACLAGEWVKCLCFYGVEQPYETCCLIEEGAE